MRESDPLMTRFELSVLTGLPFAQLVLYAAILLVGTPIALLAGWLLKNSGAPSFVYLPLGMLFGLTVGVVIFLILSTVRRLRK